MLRTFPSENATSDILNRFQKISDALLRPVNSNETHLPVSGATAAHYDETSLSKLTNMSSELLADAADKAGITNAMNDDDKDENANVNDNNIDSGDRSDAGMLAMIFKIVPIGMKIASRGKTIATGFKEASMGIVNLVKNTALLTAITAIDTITFGFQFAIYLFKLLFCSVSILTKFPNCVIYYLIDIFIFVVLVCIVSLLFIVDIFLMVKVWAGVSCVETFIMILTIFEKIDQFIYSMLSFHLIHYPDSIIQKCYACSAMGDTSGFKSVASRLFQDVFVKVPSGIGGAIGETITGIGHIFSFLSL